MIGLKLWKHCYSIYMRQGKYIAMLALLLAMLSAARFVSKYMPFPGLPKSARSLGISPNPAPLSTVRTWQGVESRGTDFVCEDTQGNTKTVRWDHHVMNRIQAPTRVRAHLSGALGLFAEDEPILGRALMERILCQESLFKTAIGCEGQLRSVEIRFYSHENEADRSRRSYKFLCERSEK
jgi:hypothetical protein